MAEGQFALTGEISHSKGVFNQICATVIVSLGSFGLGEVFAWSALVPLQLTKYGFGDDNIRPNEEERSWLASLALFGALLSGPPSGYCVNKFGAQRAMTVFAVTFIIGWLLIAFASNLWMMYFGRLITGWSGGAYTVIIPVYVSEVVEDRLRGPCGYGVVLGIVSGILFMFIIGPFLSWFTLSLICIGPILLLFFLPCLLPQSPRFLLNAGRVNDAKKALQWLRGASSPDLIETELNEIKRSVESKNGETKGSWKLLLKRSNALPTAMIIALFFFQQMSGVNAITMFTMEIFTSTDGTKSKKAVDPNTATLIVGTVQFVFVILSIFVINKVRKKLFLILCNIVETIGLASLGAYYYLKEQNKGEPPEGLGWLPITSVSMYLIAYSLGGGPLPWVFMNDCLPENIRGTTSAIATSFYWIMAFVSTKTFTETAKSLGYAGSFWVYAAITASATAFAIFIVPETKGKSLAEIQRYFGSEIEMNGNDLSAHTDLLVHDSNENEAKNNNTVTVIFVETDTIT